jgi:ribonuclease III
VRDIKELQQTLGLSFSHPALLEQAMVHSSYINENPTHAAGHNERLEFLGDAVLGFIIADRLFKEHPDIGEGDMTRLRAALVRGETLARIANQIGLGSHLLMGKGEESTGGKNKVANLAGAMEALIAAVYLEFGITTTGDLVTRLYSVEWEELTSRGAVADYKSRLQEVVQSKYQEIPLYRLISETGPDHDKQFRVEVIVNARVIGSGTGKSKKMAETEAAREALQRLAVGFTE